MNLISLDKITVGSDPEFFIVDSKNEAFPSTHLFRGTKEHPEKMTEDGFALVKDNVLIEGNIPPANSMSEFVSYMKILKHMINGVLQLAGLRLHAADSMKYKPRFLQHDEARQFGCSAYKNGWKSGLFRAENMNHLAQRVAGFHIHIGYDLLGDTLTKERMNEYVARAFDFFVTYPSRLHHYDEFRAKYYGMFGVYRDTSYGIECRALGGFFTDDSYLEWVYAQTIKTITFCSELSNLEKLEQVITPVMDNTELMSNMYNVLGIELEKQLIK